MNNFLIYINFRKGYPISRRKVVFIFTALKQRQKPCNELQFQHNYLNIVTNILCIVYTSDLYR